MAVGTKPTTAVAAPTIDPTTLKILKDLQKGMERLSNNTREKDLQIPQTSAKREGKKE